MTLPERAQIATQTRQSMANERAAIFLRMLNDGINRKTALYYLGVSPRTASRYRKIAG